MKKRVVIKVGSNVLTRKNGTLDITRMSAIVDQIAALHQVAVQVILVSSGAVASGRTALNIDEKLDTVSSRQLYSAVGQAKLINRYYDLFLQHKIACGQVLATKEDFATRRHYLNQRNCMLVMLEHGVIPIVNENDTISVNELMFTDNDELSGLVAAMMNASQLIILSNIDGVYNGNPKEEGTAVIPRIEPTMEHVESFIQTAKSTAGRGGMQTKYNIARKVAEEGIEVIIANGERDNILLDVLYQEGAICTRFTPSDKNTSSIKKWIAHSEGFAKGELHINEGAEEALQSEQAVSLLPIGLTKVVGAFECDDIVRILSSRTGEQLAIGKSAYSSAEAKKLIGVKDQKPIVHYDYLYIEK